MKGLIDTVKNIYKIEDLRNRIATTIGFVLIYRLGAHVVLPGVDPMKLENLRTQTADGVMGLLNMFSGGAFSNASVFALGIMPYISASENKPDNPLAHSAYHGWSSTGLFNKLVCTST